MPVYWNKICLVTFPGVWDLPGHLPRIPVRDLNSSPFIPRIPPMTKIFTVSCPIRLFMLRLQKRWTGMQYICSKFPSFFSASINERKCPSAKSWPFRSIYVHIQLFIFISRDSHFFFQTHRFSLYSINHYLLGRSNCSSIGHWNHLQLSPLTFGHVPYLTPPQPHTCCFRHQHWYHHLFWAFSSPPGLICLRHPA